MADKVGKVHIHDLPANHDLPIREDVYKCYCGTEFMVEEKEGTRFGKENKKWVPVPGEYAVEYDRTVGGEKFVGRAGPDTVFDEEATDGGVAEGTGTEVSGEGEGSSGTTTGV